MGDQCKHIRGFDTICRCSDACLAVVPAQHSTALGRRTEQCNLSLDCFVTVASNEYLII